MSKFTKAQQLMVDNYGGGDYAPYDWTTTEEVETADTEGRLGDTLFLFIIRELRDANGDDAEGANMLRRAAEQLEEMASKIDAELCS
jgi:hypothetical protein